MGTNEGLRDAAYHGIKALRSHVAASKVMWIAPGPQFPSRGSVLLVASQFGDEVYERPWEDLAKDGIHFSKNGSRRIAKLLSPSSSGNKEQEFCCKPP